MHTGLFDRTGQVFMYDVRIARGERTRPSRPRRVKATREWMYTITAHSRAEAPTAITAIRAFRASVRSSVASSMHARISRRKPGYFHAWTQERQSPFTPLCLIDYVDDQGYHQDIVTLA